MPESDRESLGRTCRLHGGDLGTVGGICGQKWGSQGGAGGGAGGLGGGLSTGV